MNISIIGDSISTYTGYNPEGYKVYYDAERRRANGLTSVNDTWWMRVINGLGGSLCVNNSFSGSLVSGDSFPAGCCAERTGGLHTDTARPDIILVYAGVNDCGWQVPVKGRKTDSFRGAYAKMLRDVHANYPDARIICGTLMKRYARGSGKPDEFTGAACEPYSDVIRRCSRLRGCSLAELSETRYETLDWLHPTARGHAEMALVWLGALKDILQGEK